MTSERSRAFCLRRRRAILDGGACLTACCYGDRGVGGVGVYNEAARGGDDDNAIIILLHTHNGLWYGGWGVVVMNFSFSFLPDIQFLCRNTVIIRESFYLHESTNDTTLFH